MHVRAEPLLIYLLVQTGLHAASGAVPYFGSESPSDGAVFYKFPGEVVLCHRCMQTDKVLGPAGCMQL